MVIYCSALQKTRLSSTIVRHFVPFLQTCVPLLSNTEHEGDMYELVEKRCQAFLDDTRKDMHDDRVVETDLLTTTNIMRNLPWSTKSNASSTVKPALQVMLVQNS